MSLTTPSDFYTDSFQARVVLLESRMKKVIVQMDQGPIRLPSIRMSRRERGARTFQRWLGNRDLSGAMLDLLFDPSTGRALVLAETFSGKLPPEMVWLDVDRVPDGWWSEREATCIRALLATNTPSAPGDPGWLREAVTWAEEIAHDHLRSIEGITQWNASSRFTLIRLSMERDTYWLKATGTPNAHEFLLTRFISSFRSTSAPTVVGWRDDWNAWLMKEEGTALSSMPLEPTEIFALMEKAIHAIAELQLASIGKTDALFTAGAFDQRLPRMSEALDWLFHILEEASTQEVVTNGTGNDLAAIRSAFERASERLESAQTPSTLLHGDLNLGNLIVTPRGCILLDWAETYVGNPFCSLQHLLLLNPVRDRAMRSTMESLWITQYRNILLQGMTQEALEEGLASMPLMAALAALYGRGDWIGGDETAQGRKRNYARALLPHLHRAAKQFGAYAAGETLCAR